MPPHLHLRGRTLSTVGLITAGACGLLGTPAAHASSSSVTITTYANDTTIGAGGAGRDIPITVGTYSMYNMPTYTNVTVSIDTSKLAGVAAATTTQSGCTTSGTKITCDLGTITEANSWKTLMLHVAAVSGAKAGASGQFTLSGWADGVAATSTNQATTVTLADGPDLGFSSNAAGTSAASVNLTRGQTYTTPHFTFENYGSQSAEGVTIYYNAPYEAPFVNLASNCQYAADTDDAGKPTYAACYFPNVITPGESDVITTPQQLTIRNDTVAGFGDYVNVQAMPGYHTGSDVNSSLTWFSGTGPALAIQPTSGTQSTTSSEVTQTNVDPQGDYILQGFQVTNGVTADLAAVGATVTASGGSSVTVTVSAFAAFPDLVGSGGRIVDACLGPGVLDGADFGIGGLSGVDG